MNFKQLELGNPSAIYGNNHTLKNRNEQLSNAVNEISQKDVMANVEEISNHRMPYKVPTVVLRCPIVIERTAMSRAALYEKMRPTSKYFDPTFPRSIRISERSVGWIASEIDDWISAQMAKREGSPK